MISQPSIISCISVLTPLSRHREGGPHSSASLQPIERSSDLWRLLRVMRPVALAPQCDTAGVDTANRSQTSWELGPADLSEGCTRASLVSQPYTRDNCIPLALERMPAPSMFSLPDAAAADVGVFHPDLSRLSRGRLQALQQPSYHGNPALRSGVEDTDELASAMKHLFSRYIGTVFLGD